jgi:hypothetical protein
MDRSEISVCNAEGKGPTLQVSRPEAALCEYIAEAPGSREVRGVLTAGGVQRLKLMATTIEPARASPAPSSSSKDTQLPPIEIASVQPSAGLSTARVAALGAGAASLVALGSGVILSVVASSTQADANAICPGVQCGSAQAVRLSSRAVTLADFATVSFAVFGVALAGAAVLWIAGSASEPTASAEIALSPTGIQLRGTW